MNVVTPRALLGTFLLGCQSAAHLLFMPAARAPRDSAAICILSILHGNVS